jgi:hypothetical protein
VDRYLEFVAGRSQANTLRAVAFDLKAFFAVVELYAYLIARGDTPVLASPVPPGLATLGRVARGGHQRVVPVAGRFLQALGVTCMMSSQRRPQTGCSWCSRDRGADCRTPGT